MEHQQLIQKHSKLQGPVAQSHFTFTIMCFTVVSVLFRKISVALKKHYHIVDRIIAVFIRKKITNIVRK